MKPIEQLCALILSQIVEHKAPVALLRMHPDTYRTVCANSVVLAGRGHEVCGIPVLFDRSHELGRVTAERGA